MLIIYIIIYKLIFNANIIINYNKKYVCSLCPYLRQLLKPLEFPK